MNAYERISLLTKPVWTLKEMMAYLAIASRTTGEKIKSTLFKSYEGQTEYGSKYVKRDALLTYLGTNVKREMEVLNETLQKWKVQK